MKELRTEIVINAPVERIWNILMDFDHYPEWNPFIRDIQGSARIRERLRVKLQLQDGRPMIFKPKVTKYRKHKEFAWLGQLFMAGLFDGQHIFEIKEIDEEQFLFVQREEFSGLLVGLFWRQLDTKTREAFVAMNEKLKELSEKQRL